VCDALSLPVGVCVPVSVALCVRELVADRENDPVLEADTRRVCDAVAVPVPLGVPLEVRDGVRVMLALGVAVSVALSD
jgi:hypothetical protein